VSGGSWMDTGVPSATMGPGRYAQALAFLYVNACALGWVTSPLDPADSMRIPSSSIHMWLFAPPPGP
jgi:hypothetical protein